MKLISMTEYVLKIAKERIDYEVRMEDQREADGYNFCITCGRNDCQPVTCAHIISVKEAKETGRTELCWSVKNMVPEGLPCHQKRDKLNLF